MNDKVANMYQPSFAGNRLVGKVKGHHKIPDVNNGKRVITSTIRKVILNDGKEVSGDGIFDIDIKEVVKCITKNTTYKLFH